MKTRVKLTGARPPGANRSSDGPLLVKCQNEAGPLGFGIGIFFS